MTRLRVLLARLLGLVAGRRRDAVLDEEIQAHLDLLIEEHQRAGLSERDARSAARRDFGGVIQTKETYRDRRGLPFLDTLIQDIRYAARSLRRSPGFVFTAILSLALGIGVNAGVFTIARALLFQPLAVDQPDEIVRIYDNHHSPLSYAEYRWLRERLGSVPELVAERIRSVVAVVDEQPEAAIASLVSGNFFSGLHVRPTLGRPLQRRDEDASTSEVVISHNYWSQRLAADPLVIGRGIRLNDRPFTVVGVAPAGFSSSMFGWSPDFFIGLNDLPVLVGSRPEAFSSSYYLAGRLRSAATVDLAQAEVTTLNSQMRQDLAARSPRSTLRVTPARGVVDEIREGVSAVSGFLLGVAGLVFAIAAANVGNLLLARNAGRKSELGVRLALGASRARLIRLLVTEGALLAGAGTALALAATASTVGLATRLIPPEVPLRLDIKADALVVAFSVGLAVIAVLIFAVVPALHASRQDAITAIRQAGDRVSQSSRLRRVFLIAQVAICTVLLVGSSLFLRSLGRATQMNPGFPTDGLLDAHLALEGGRYDREAGVVFWQRLLDRVRIVPGVENAATAAVVPLTMENIENTIFREGDAPLPDDRPRARTYVNVVSDSYFTTMGIPLRRGREFAATDRDGAPSVVIINETLANRLWPDEDPIGKRISIAGGPSGPWREVVGVAANIRYSTLGEEPPIFSYLPAGQVYRQQMVVHVRASDPSAAGVLARTLGSVVRSIDPALAPASVRSIADDQQIVLLPAKVGAALLGAFGLLALVLAGVGMFGVAAYDVAQRTREIGIRAALGARQATVIKAAMRDMALTVTSGVVLGVLLALGAGRLIASFLYGIGGADPATFALVPLILASAAVVATFIPARRAARVDPMVALRCE